MYPSDKEPIENLLGNRRSHFYDILSDFSVRFFQSSSFNANAKVKNVFFFHSCRGKIIFLSLCEIAVKKKRGGFGEFGSEVRGHAWVQQEDEGLAERESPTRHLHHVSRK